KWTNKDPFPKPPMRYCHATAYDAQSDRVILFGGDLAGGLFNDTWAYDFNTNAWTDMAPGLSPPATLCDAMAYDSESDRLIMFGGVGSPVYLNDTWAYEFNKNTWTNAPAGPSARYSHAMVYDSQTDRVILFGGYSVGPGSGYLNDTWAYDFNTNAWTSMDHPVPLSAPQRLTTSPGHTQVRLDWQAPASTARSTIPADNVYRGTAPGSSALFATVGNVLTYADDAVTNGATYYYQAAALNIAGEGPRSNEVSATPTAAPDSTPPTAAIGSLPNNTVVNSTTITLTGTASDNVAIEKVEVSADGSTWILATGTTSWSATLTLREGQNTIFVRTTDTSGNVSIAT